MILQTNRITVAPPPAKPEIRTGDEHARLQATALKTQAKGRLILTRYTAPIKGENFLLQIHAARRRATGEVWHSATYHSATIPGHARTLLIDPAGVAWLLLPGDAKQEPRAVSNRNKYAAHLFQIQ